jgi:hypothetical protein
MDLSLRPKRVERGRARDGALAEGVGRRRPRRAAFLAAFARLKYANHVGGDGAGGIPYELQSYAYAVLAAGAAALGAVLLQAPVAAYLLCRGGGPSAAALDASMYADMAATAALASGVGAGFGATSDARQMVENLVRWERGGGARGDLDAYYDRGGVALVFLLAGMILSMCASVVSARIRARAGGEEGHILGN